jgi:hypothetical protein
VATARPASRQPGALPSSCRRTHPRQSARTCWRHSGIG